MLLRDDFIFLIWILINAFYAQLKMTINAMVDVEGASKNVVVFIVRGFLENMFFSTICTSNRSKNGMIDSILLPYE